MITSEPAAQQEESKGDGGTVMINTGGDSNRQKRSPSEDLSAVEVADNLERDIMPGDTDEPLERDELPWLKDPNSRPSIWTILKDTMGKDFSRMAVPVYFNDPTRLLQKCAQSMEYNYLLD